MTDRKIEIIVFSISKIFYSLLILFTSFILVRLFSSSDYGIFQQFIVISRMFIPPISSIVFNFVFYRFSEKDEELLSKGVALAHLLGGVSFFFSLFIGYVVLKGKVSWVFEVGIAVYVLLISSISFYEHYLLSLKEYHRSSLYLIVVSLLFLIFAVFPAIFARKVIYSVLGLIIYALIRYVWVMGVVWSRVKSIKRAFISIWNHIRYLFPLGATYFSGSVSSSLDKLIISTFRLPSEFAHYINGVISIPFIQILVGSLVNALMPEFSESIKDDKETFIKKWHASIIFTATFLYPVMFFLFFFAKHVMVILFSHSYIDSSLYFRIALMVLIVRITTYGNLLSLLGKTKELFYITIADFLLVLVTSVMFYKLWGLVGPAISYVLVTYLQIALFIYVISKEMGISFKNILPYKELFNILIFSLVISFFIFYLVRMVGPRDDFIIVLFGSILLVLFIMLQFVNRLIGYVGIVLLFLVSIFLTFLFKNPVVVAHKGIYELPESVISIAQSQRAGYKYIECDWHLLSDTALVLSHDPILKDEKVCSYSISDSIYRSHYGVGLAKIEDVLSILTASQLFMELKTYQTDGVENAIYLDSLMPEIVNNIVKENKNKIYYVISFDPNVILAITSEVKRGFLVNNITLKEVSKRFNIPSILSVYAVLYMARTKGLNGVFIEKGIYSYPLYIIARLLRVELYLWTLEESDRYPPCDGVIVNVDYE